VVSPGVLLEWRGSFDNGEVNALHAEAFGTRVYTDEEWNWEQLTGAHSLGWVTARAGGLLVGFVNVLWDGLVHAWIQDVMVAAESRSRGIGKDLVAAGAAGAREAGCEWLHVDFEPELEDFYITRCGFAPARAGLLSLAD